MKNNVNQKILVSTIDHSFTITCLATKAVTTKGVK